MGTGEFTLEEIYRAVKQKRPDLCDDTYLCSTNCKHGHNHPEWMHRVRAALYEIKQKPGSRIKNARRKHWIIGGAESSAVLQNDEEAFAEGHEILALHRKKERNRRAVNRKKAVVIAETGSLRCEVCEFDFQSVYGELGSGFAECHHRVPLAQLTQEHRLKLSELAIVCANCHRMLHRRRNITVEALREIMRVQVSCQPKQP